MGRRACRGREGAAEFLRKACALVFCSDILQLPAVGLNGVEQHALLASRFSLLALGLGIGLSDVANANCANSGAVLLNGPQAHNVGEYWFDGEDTAYPISSWYDSELTLQPPLEDEDFYAEVPSGGGSGCVGENCGGPGENPGLNATPAKKLAAPTGGEIQSCVTLGAVHTTARAISGGRTGIVRLYRRYRTGGAGVNPQEVAVSGRTPKEFNVPAEGTCQVDIEVRQGAAASAHALLASPGGVRTARDDVIRVTYTDGKTESWRIVSSPATGYVSVSPWTRGPDGGDSNTRMPTECLN